jgi:hypothetical protein
MQRRSFSDHDKSSLLEPRTVTFVPLRVMASDTTGSVIIVKKTDINTLGQEKAN